MKNHTKLILILPALTFGLLFTSCRQPEPPVGRVSVFQDDGTGTMLPATEINVKLTAAEPCNNCLIYLNKDQAVYEIFKTTDEGGTVQFDLCYPAIMKVEAWYYVGNDSVVESGILKFEEGEIAEERIDLPAL